MTTPHASWAEVYDTTYAHSFGASYARFTQAHLDLITSMVQPPAHVVDFGAGTGRLAIPLAKQGYAVVAVDPCAEMLEQLAGKQKTGNVTTVNERIQDFRTDQPFDMALCLFTVLAYILDDEARRASIAALASSLSPGGFVLVDIPSRALFRSYEASTSTVRRSVQVSALDEQRYRYHEDITLTSGDSVRAYSDSFTIRHWNAEFVIGLFGDSGLRVKDDVSRNFSATGSRHLILQRTE